MLASRKRQLRPNWIRQCWRATPPFACHQRRCFHFKEIVMTNWNNFFGFCGLPATKPRNILCNKLKNLLTNLELPTFVCGGVGVGVGMADLLFGICLPFNGACGFCCFTKIVNWVIPDTPTGRQTDVFNWISTFRLTNAKLQAYGELCGLRSSTSHLISSRFVWIMQLEVLRAEQKFNRNGMLNSCVCKSMKAIKKLLQQSWNSIGFWLF